MDKCVCRKEADNNPHWMTDNIVKTDKLAFITEMVLSLDELDNTDNLEGGRLINVLLRYKVINPENNGPKEQWYN